MWRIWHLVGTWMKISAKQGSICSKFSPRFSCNTPLSSHKASRYVNHLHSTLLELRHFASHWQCCLKPNILITLQYNLPEWVALQELQHSLNTRCACPQRHLWVTVQQSHAGVIKKPKNNFETRDPLIALETHPWYLRYAGITILTLTGENSNFKHAVQSSHTKIFQNYTTLVQLCLLHHWTKS